MTAVGRAGLPSSFLGREDSAGQGRPPRCPALTDSPQLSDLPLAPEACLGTSAVLCGSTGLIPLWAPPAGGNPGPASS